MHLQNMFTKTLKITQLSLYLCTNASNCKENEKYFISFLLLKPLKCMLSIAIKRLGSNITNISPRILAENNTQSCIVRCKFVYGRYIYKGCIFWTTIKFNQKHIGVAFSYLVFSWNIFTCLYTSDLSVLRS